MTGSVAVAVLVPALQRPHRVKPLLNSFGATTPEARVTFICDPDDVAEIEAVRADGRAEILLHAGNYAQKITAGVAATDEPLVFTAADDLRPRPGWLEHAMARLGGGIEVVGVNDLIPRRRGHAPHFLMTRAYAEQPTVDGGPGPFHHGYNHWFCDDELIATAKLRGVYAYAGDAVVEHRHPGVGKGCDDAVYQRGRAYISEDTAIFAERQALWAP